MYLPSLRLVQEDSIPLQVRSMKQQDRVSTILEAVLRVCIPLEWLGPRFCIEAHVYLGTHFRAVVDNIRKKKKKVRLRFSLSPGVNHGIWKGRSKKKAKKRQKKAQTEILLASRTPVKKSPEFAAESAEQKIHR